MNKKTIKGTVEVTIRTTTTESETLKDDDLKAIYLISEAMRISTPRMRKENLNFVLHKYKIQALNRVL